MLAGELRPRPRGVSSERGMPARSRVLTKDEELGKRDDDFRPATSRTSILSSLLPWHWRRRRMLLVLVLVGIIYFFAQNIPTYVPSVEIGPHKPLGVSDDEGPRVTLPSYHNHKSSKPSDTSTEPEGAPPRERDDEEDETAKHYFNGNIKFYKLGDSLQDIMMTMGSRPVNRNVLFAASSLKSFANLVPMACEMSKQEHAYAHFVLFGRSTLSMDELLEINGVDKSTCSVYFHDARADYPEYSSDRRAETSVIGAMLHIQNYMHPQALIVDDRSNEDRFFADAIKRKAKQIDKPLIEIPRGRYEDFLWITRLDAGSLSNWFKVTIDIVIQAPSGSAGSLLRLLKSLKAADYDAIKAPRLTVELPANPEAFVVGALARLKWPPSTTDTLRDPTMLTVRHRIPSSKISSEQASLRFLETFYPNDPNNHHVLVLSPQAELHPLYMQYLYFLILKHKHSSFGSPGFEDVVGLSLDVPSSKLDGSGFDIPLVANLTSWRFQQQKDLDQDMAAPFLYQTPSSGAALILGDKWVTFHNFLANRMASFHAGKAKKAKKLISESEPAWMEHLLELIRARGWSMLYPSMRLVTLHNEMAQVPEEFLRLNTDASESDATQTPLPKADNEEPFLVADVPPVMEDHVEADLSNDFGPLHKILPFKGDVLDIVDMPLYSYEGQTLDNLDLFPLVKEYKQNFRNTVGGCTSQEAQRSRQVDWMDTKDLFCLSGMESEYSVEDADAVEQDDDNASLAQILAGNEPKDMDEAAAEARHAATSSSGSPKPTSAVIAEARDELEVGGVTGAS